MSLEKTVFHIHMKTDKQRKKAMKIIAPFHGMISTKIGGGDRNEVEATGVGVDWARLAMELRKKVGFAIIVSLGEVKEEKKEIKKETTSSPAINHNYCYCHCMCPRYYN